MCIFMYTFFDMYIYIYCHLNCVRDEKQKGKDTQHYVYIRGPYMYKRAMHLTHDDTYIYIYTYIWYIYIYIHRYIYIYTHIYYICTYLCTYFLIFISVCILPFELWAWQSRSTRCTIYIQWLYSWHMNLHIHIYVNVYIYTIYMYTYICFEYVHIFLAIWNVAVTKQENKMRSGCKFSESRNSQKSACY